jgi:hypothetical protein
MGGEDLQSVVWGMKAITYGQTYQVCRSQNTLTALKLNAEALKYRRSVGGPQVESLYVQVRIDWRGVGESIEAA